MHPRWQAVPTVQLHQLSRCIKCTTNTRRQKLDQPESHPYFGSGVWIQKCTLFIAIAATKNHIARSYIKMPPNDPMREVLFEQTHQEGCKAEVNRLLESCSDAHAVIHPGFQFETINLQQWTDIVNTCKYGCAPRAPFPNNMRSCQNPLKWL